MNIDWVKHKEAVSEKLGKLWRWQKCIGQYFSTIATLRNVNFSSQNYKASMTDWGI